MSAQSKNLFASCPCVWCSQPVGSTHLLLSTVQPGRRRRFCSVRCLEAWATRKVHTLTERAVDLAIRARSGGQPPSPRYAAAVYAARPGSRARLAPRPGPARSRAPRPGRGGTLSQNGTVTSVTSNTVPKATRQPATKGIYPSSKCPSGHRHSQPFFLTLARGVQKNSGHYKSTRKSGVCKNSIALTA